MYNKEINQFLYLSQIRNLIDQGRQTPVNFRSSPPLEALKPHRGHLQRSSTPLVLTETSRGIESIRISCDSPPLTKTTAAAAAMTTTTTAAAAAAAMTTTMDVRSISPPAKFFHCAVSPRRRPPRHHHSMSQRLQRPHRPCLDFDKMQQVRT